MYTSKTKLVIIAMLVGSFIVIITSHSQNKLTEGQQPYTPNRLERLEVRLNTQFSHFMQTDKFLYAVIFDAMPERNTIRISIVHASHITRILNLTEQTTLLGNSIKKETDEKLFLEPALRGYDLSKLRDEEPSVPEIVKIS